MPEEPVQVAPPSLSACGVHQRLCARNAGYSHLLTHMTAEAVEHVQMKGRSCVSCSYSGPTDFASLAMQSQLNSYMGSCPPDLAAVPQAIIAAGAGANPYAAFEHLVSSQHSQYDSHTRSGWGSLSSQDCSHIALH